MKRRAVGTAASTMSQTGSQPEQPLRQREDRHFAKVSLRKRSNDIEEDGRRLMKEYSACHENPGASRSARAEVAFPA
jgi:hypothetical protein